MPLVRRKLDMLLLLAPRFRPGEGDLVEPGEPRREPTRFSGTVGAWLTP